MEPMNDVNESQVSVVETQEDSAVTESAVPPETVPAPPQEVAKPAQTPEENRAFREMRLKTEALAKEKAELEKIRDGYREALSQFGYEGESDDEIQVNLIAARQQKTPEEVRADMKAEEERARQLLETSPEFLQTKQELEEYKRKDMEIQFSSDLKAIKEAYPDEKAAKIEDFGIQFLELCAAGIAPLTAYEALRNEKKRTSTVPVSTGDIKPANTEKEFFTSEELDRLTSKDLDDAKTLDRALRSMSRLGR